MSDGSNTLWVLPALAARRVDDDAIVLTHKFVDGIRQYQEHWPGQVAVGMYPADRESGNLGETTIPICDLPFRFEWLDEDPSSVVENVSGARLVLASLVDQHLHLAEALAGHSVPLIFVSEYTLQTRKQIIRSETSNPLLRMRRSHWTAQLEKRVEAAVPMATGIQCNGTPTYDAYRDVNENPLLYFDTRVSAADVATDEAIEARAVTVSSGEPLRLAYSGRLIAMKGVDHLPRVASMLRDADVPFTMKICGAGALEDALQAQIDRDNLGDVVELMGELDFRSELLPYVRDNVDLFVCCHRQGDPSCSYMETMACGTPIIGYMNEAFEGIVRTTGVGWAVPIDRPDAMAERIARLHEDRSALISMATQSRDIAARHTFESTMKDRVEHMKMCAGMRAHRAAS
ncbi:MAG: glycosyltransferase [Planctomycetota bacterium]